MAAPPEEKSAHSRGESPDEPSDESPDESSDGRAALRLNQPVFTERDGEEIVGLYHVEGDVLHVAVGRYARSAALHGSNPEVLAHVLLDALVDDIVLGRLRPHEAAALR